MNVKPVTLRANAAATYCGVSRREFDRVIRPLVRAVRLVPGADPLFFTADLDALLLARVVYEPPTTRAERAI
ncbi:MAG: hypothetical protein RLZZ524_2528 [Pseudomonadota bacterium]